jgi:hypothetical protein
MSSVEELIEQLKQLTELIKSAGNEAIVKNTEEIEAMNRGQLLKGINTDGELLPRYIDDPYFKTPEQALRYQAWKSNISPDSSKPKEVMDFYINGQFHNTIELTANGNEFKIDSDSDISNSVEGKTGGKAIGLSPENEDKVTQVIVENIEFETDKMFL